ncbi:hypothetical protein M3Y97_00376600 [Aphelenchoides bicaudatus]|nr:hypothetical protein M3Y97_00376600 [Aphelenchoides bicaudatus]
MKSEELFGLKKFAQEYNSKFRPADKLQEQANRVIEKYTLEAEQKKLDAKRKRKVEDDDGWVTVTKKDKHVFSARKALPGAIVAKKNDEPVPKKRPRVKLV